MRRHYYYTAIATTPFTLIVSLPDKYGASKVHGVEEIRRSLAEGERFYTFLLSKRLKLLKKYFVAPWWSIKIMEIFQISLFSYKRNPYFEIPLNLFLYFLGRTISIAFF